MSQNISGDRVEKKVTIDDVARRCGVSKTTVSRCLNHKYDNISTETVERIERVIRELDFRPNRTAQRLKSRHTQLIGCSLGDVTNPFSALLLKGLTQVLEQAGYQVLFSDSGEQPGRERAAIEGFLENKVDGLIVNTTGGNDSYLLDIKARGVHIVLADRSLPGETQIDTVIAADKEATRECVEQLLRLGYRRIAYFTEGDGLIMPRLRRREGYEQAIAALCPGQIPLIYSYDAKAPGACAAAVRSFLDAFPGERKAILAVNGVTAQHLITALQEAQISVGYALGFITFDDWFWLKLTPPGISAVALESEKIGAEAARLLLRRIEAGEGQTFPPELRELPAPLHLRASTTDKDRVF